MPILTVAGIRRREPAGQARWRDGAGFPRIPPIPTRDGSPPTARSRRSARRGWGWARYAPAECIECIECIDDIAPIEPWAGIVRFGIASGAASRRAPRMSRIVAIP